MKKNLLLIALAISGKLLAQSGVIDSTFNPGTGTNNSVYATAIQSDGKIIIAGNFTSYSGTSINRIARLNSDGSLDGTFNVGAGANSSISAITIQPDGKIIIGGGFSSYSGIPINCIARINTDGSLDTTFAVGSGANGFVLSIALQADAKIIIGGYFTSYNLTSANYLARLNPNGSLDTTYIIGTGLNNNVYSTTMQSDGKMIFAGNFNLYNGTTVVKIIRLNTDGTLDGTFTPGTGPNGTTYTMATQTDNKIIIGGNSSMYDGTPRDKIARLNSDGTLDGTFNVGTGLNSLPFAIAIQPDAKIIIGGCFTSYNGTAINRIVRLNTNGSFDSTFTVGTGADNCIGSISLQSDNKIIIGGDFNSYNGIARNRVARLLNCTPITILATASTICNGTAVTLYGSGASSYLWTGGVIDSVAFTPSATSTYTVTGSGIPSECSSTATVTVTVNQPSNGSQTFVECAGFSISVGTNTYTSSGIYTDVLVAANGCDSTVTTNLTITSVDNTTSTLLNVISANASGAIYQWIDCNSGNSPISGEINQSYTATANGDYAVIIAANGCVDTSSCVNINTIGIEKNSAQKGIAIYPNPVTNGNINVELNNLEAGSYSMVLYNALGKQVFYKSIEVSNQTTSKIQIQEQLAKGIYFVKVNSKRGTVLNKKITIQ